MKIDHIPSRNYIAADFDPSQLAQVSAAYEDLAQQNPATPTALRLWILHWSELESILSDYSSRLYIAMTVDTTDAKAAQVFEDFNTQIVPIINASSDKLQRILHQHPHKNDLSAEFGHWFQSVSTDISLFRTENIPLYTKIALETQAYQKITGNMSVNYAGSEKTLAQMGVYLQNPERKTREEAWRLTSQRRLTDQKPLDDAFDKLFALRQQVATNSGYENNFLEYIFAAKHRFDYTPEHCRDFHDAIAQHAVPRVQKIYKRRAKIMDLEALRPWDLHCDPRGLAALQPFETGAELLDKSSQVFEHLAPQLGTWFAQLRQQNLLDVDSRLGKAPGGYQISLDEARLPFIFMNAAGTDGDVYTMLHEAGHAFHQFAMAKQPILAFRNTPSEFAEVASMSMELIASQHLDVFYSPAEIVRSRIDHLEEIIILLPWVALIDAFQHELYTRPQHDAEERREIWQKLHKRFDSGVDWSGLELERDYWWQKQLHLFEVPFYYIEYGIAQLGALQLWHNYRQDPQATLQQMLNAYALGNSQPLPQLFAAAGLKFDFSAETLEPLLQAVEQELAQLYAQQDLC